MPTLRTPVFDCRKYEKAENEMRSLSTKLNSVDAHVEQLRSAFEESTKSATQIKIDLEREQAAIGIAGTLVERLGGEFERWQRQAATLAEERERVSECSTCHETQHAFRLFSSTFIALLLPLLSRISVLSEFARVGQRLKQCC